MLSVAVPPIAVAEAVKKGVVCMVTRQINISSRKPSCCVGQTGVGGDGKLLRECA